MKTMNKLVYGIILCLSVLIVSCDGAEDEEFGTPLLYIPQATIQSGGANNNYYVDLKYSTLDDTTVVVGLYRSGLQKLEKVSVSLSVDADTLNKAISQSATNTDFALYENANLLPSDYYILPEGITLNDGVRDTWVEIKISKKQLLDIWTDPNAIYVLPVRISNPTKYTLNEKLSLVMFIFRKK